MQGGGRVILQLTALGVSFNLTFFKIGIPLWLRGGRGGCHIRLAEQEADQGRDLQRRALSQPMHEKRSKHRHEAPLPPCQGCHPPRAILHPPLAPRQLSIGKACSNITPPHKPGRVHQLLPRRSDSGAHSPSLPLWVARRGAAQQ